MAGLTLDRLNPYRQITNLWTTIIQGREMPFPAASLKTWANEAIAAMPSLPIPAGKDGNAWAMLGSLYYKSLDPDWTGDYRDIQRCEEAKRCYQEALRISDVPMWKDFFDGF